MCGDSDQPIVTCGLTVFRLLSFDHADETRVNQTAGECRFVHQQENVNWIAIRSVRGRNKSEVVWKAAADGQNATQPEDVFLFVILKLVAMALRRLDHYCDFAIGI